jgi:hypothetical protein
VDRKKGTGWDRSFQMDWEDSSLILSVEILWKQL